MDIDDKYHLGEPISGIRSEAFYATRYYKKVHAKKLAKNHSSLGREGKIYLIEGCPYVLLEDDGEKGMFRPLGKKVAGLQFKPLSCFIIEGLFEIV